MNKLVIVLCFGLAAACGGVSVTSDTNADGGAGGAGGSGGGDIGAFLGSCTWTPTVDQKFCNDYYAGTASQSIVDDTKKNPCPSIIVGDQSMMPCVHTNSNGGCRTKTSDGLVQTNWSYQDSADTAKKKCSDSNGTFVNP